MHQLPSPAFGSPAFVSPTDIRPVAVVNPVSTLDTELQRYLQLLNGGPKPAISSVQGDPRREEIKMAPLFSWTAKHLAFTKHNFDYPQYALLGQLMPILTNETETSPTTEQLVHEPVFLNTDIPWSAFICGQQGSGKSYTLSCILEGRLLQSPNIGKLPQPLTGVVFNYDSQAGDVCEAAYLCSASIKVTVLVSPSNFEAMKKLYSRIPGAKQYLKVQPLYIKPSHLNTERMKRLMACGNDDDRPPLYMQTVIKTLRQMALDSKGGAQFDYDEFRKRLDDENFTKEQCGPLDLRLDLLESFMKGDIIDPSANKDSGPSYKAPQKRKPKKVDSLGAEIFVGNPGELKIVDLTDPVIDASSACVLFDICLAIFLEKTKCGKVIALDEAHNYISKGVASDNFTNNILKAVREQRHKGARIIVATQEPTISPKFLDLCSMTIVHKFNSPDWWKALKDHLRGASKESGLTGEALEFMFRAIGHLRTGESLLFAGSALFDVEDDAIKDLENGHKKMRTRPRISDDGGKSHTATGKEYSQDASPISAPKNLLQSLFAVGGNAVNDHGLDDVGPSEALLHFNGYFEEETESAHAQRHYQTITAINQYRGMSVEELRLADYMSRK